MIAIAKCASCGYPMTSSSLGTRVSCPYCKTLNESVSTKVSRCGTPSKVSGKVGGIDIPTPLVFGLIGLTIGVLFGPSIIASTDAGSKWLAKKAHERIG